MPEQKVQTNPTKVIREKCIDCCCGNMAEVARCTAEKCPLHPWRMGKNPYRKKVEYTEDQLEEMRQRGRENRAKQIAAKIASEPSGGAC